MSKKIVVTAEKKTVAKKISLKMAETKPAAKKVHSLGYFARVYASFRSCLNR